MKKARQVAVSAVGAVWLLTAGLASAGKWDGNLEVEQGYWAGDATYSIGGMVRAEGESMRLHDKLSELKFPLGVAYASMGGSVTWNRRLEMHGCAMANLTDPSAKVEDSDFGIFDGSDESTLDIYSESDATLSAWAANTGVRYWFQPSASNRVAWSMGVGPGVSYQHLDWTVSNTTQWSPSHQEYPERHIQESALTYESDVFMGYMDVAARMRFNRLSTCFDLGVGMAIVQDEDNHIFTEKRSTGDMSGIGVRGSGEIRYDLPKDFFVLARVAVLLIEASGTQTQTGYGGNQDFEAEIDEDYSLTSITAGASFGYAF